MKASHISFLLSLCLVCCMPIAYGSSTADQALDSDALKTRITELYKMVLDTQYKEDIKMEPPFIMARHKGFFQSEGKANLNGKDNEDWAHWFREYAGVLDSN